MKSPTKPNRSHRTSQDSKLSDEIREMFLVNQDFRQHNRAIVLDFIRHNPEWRKLGGGRPAFTEANHNMMTLQLYILGYSEREIGQYSVNERYPKCSISPQAVGRRVSRAIAYVSQQLGCSVKELARDCHHVRKG